MHRIGGGAIKSALCIVQTSRKLSRKYKFEATPPAATNTGLISGKAFVNSLKALVHRSFKTSATAHWNEAAMSAGSSEHNLFLPSYTTELLTAVLRPEKEKSQPGRPESGLGNVRLCGLPVLAALSIAGPPG